MASNPTSKQSHSNISGIWKVGGTVLVLLLLVFVGWSYSLYSTTKEYRAQINHNVPVLIRLQVLNRALGESFGASQTARSGLSKKVLESIKPLALSSTVYVSGKKLPLFPLRPVYKSWKLNLDLSGTKKQINALNAAIFKTVKFVRKANAFISIQLGKCLDQLYILVGLAILVATACLVLLLLVGLTSSRANQLKSDLAESLKESEAARQAALEANQAKSQFLATMSHELRTPLNGIIGALKLLDSSDLPSSQVRLANMASRCADTLLSMVNDVLDFSKIEAGAFVLHNEVYCPKTVCTDVKELLFVSAQEKNVTLLLSKGSLVPKQVYGDFERVRQVLINLVANAVKFTEEGTVEIKLGSEEQGDEKWLRFEVMDNGPGLSQEQIRTIFQPFKQVESASSSTLPGTGLGLSICHQIVKMMDGEIGVVSQTGKGSCFWFRVPLMQPGVDIEMSPLLRSESSLSFVAAAEENYVRSSKEQTPNPHTPMNTFEDVTPLHILLVEDNLINQQIMKIYLKRWGHTLVVAENGLDALQCVQEQSFDMILMDCTLPIMDGLEATQNIRKLTSPNSKIPIFALTARATKEEEQNCLDAGMDKFLTKPIDYNRLQALLADISMR